VLVNTWRRILAEGTNRTREKGSFQRRILQQKMRLRFDPVFPCAKSDRGFGRATAGFAIISAKVPKWASLRGYANKIFGLQEINLHPLAATT